MDDPFLLILTGPPGAGKSTVGRLVAGGSDRSAYIEADRFWTAILTGHIEPWEQAAHGQNRAVVRAATAAAVRMAVAGYATVLDGIVGPWFFDDVRDELAVCSAPVNYVVLRPAVPVCLSRARTRVQEDVRHRHALTDEGPIRHMWEQFAHLGDAERFVLDNSSELPDGTAARVRARLADGSHAFPMQ